MQDTSKTSEDAFDVDEYTAQRQWLSESDRQSIEEAIQTGDWPGLEGSAFSRIAVIDHDYSRARKPAEGSKLDLQDLWYLYYQVGKNVLHSSPEQDKWIRHILQVRGHGPLTRQAQSSNNGGDNDESSSLEIATTSGGIIWEDLPFFTTDMTDIWVKDCATMSATQRINFSHFLAKLACIGVDDNLCTIALLVFHDVFETIRPLGSCNDENDNEDTLRTLEDLTTAALLPAAQAWLFSAGRKIIQLSDRLWNIPGAIRQGETTFTKSELGRKSSAAFSPWRWMYWLKRLEEIKIEARQAGEEYLAASILLTMEQMLTLVEQTDSRVQSELEAAGNLIKNQHRFHLNKQGEISDDEITWEDGVGTMSLE